MRRSVVTHSMGIDTPPFDEATEWLGLSHYAGACAPCHGAPGEARNPISLGEVPVPPALASEVAGWEPAQLFWIVKNGLKYTGMPAWPAQARDDEVWAVVAGILRLPHLDPIEYRRIVRGDGLLRLERAEEDARLIAAAGSVGEDLVACARCHGLSGQGRGPFPRLAGQKREYLEASLRDYALGVRPSGIMQPVAAELTADEIQELAAYFAARPLVEADAGGTADSEQIERGRVIASRGLPDRRVPACSPCHGPDPPADSPRHPHLFGQPAAYLAQQLRLFRSGVRGGTANARLMAASVKELDESDLQAVAAYYAQAPR